MRDLILYFLKLGFTAFGGPAVHIAMMRRDLVEGRKWLSEQEFMDLLGAVNLIPGPNSTELAIHIGHKRAGWPGLVAAGASFILPAMLIVLALAWLYVTYSATPPVAAILYGLQPVIIVVVLQALWGLARVAVKDRVTALAAAAALLVYVLGVSELWMLLIGALGVALWRNRHRLPIRGLAALTTAPAAAGLGTGQLQSVPVDLTTLFLVFLKIGSVLYGSGYVLLAFMRADFVENLGWLTDRQLLDAIAVGQVTPGPLFTTATFVGYVLGGVPGALLATLGIFLPAFVFVALSVPLLEQARHWPWTGGLLDGVNVASLALMAAVTVRLGEAALIDPLTVAIAAVSAVALFRTKLNPTWLLLAGALIGLATLLAP
jgi:chromate transporter